MTSTRSSTSSGGRTALRSPRFAAGLLLALAVSARAAIKIETLGVRAADGSSHPIEVTSGQAFLRLAAGTDPASLDAPLAALGAARAKDFGGGLWLVTWTGGQTVSAQLDALRGLAGVAMIDASHVYHLRRTPNDPLVNSQYQLSAVDAFGAWEYEVGASSKVTIVVIDSGIDGTQPDLSGKLVSPNRIFDQTTGAGSNNQPPTPACNHATHVAGVAAASTDNGVQVAGLSWGAQLASYKVFVDAQCNADCSDNVAPGCVANDPAIVGAISEAKSYNGTPGYGRVVINMSLGGASACSGAIQTAVTNAVSSGAVVIAAAGNDGSAVNSPGNCAGVIPMGATDSNNSIAYFSSRGAELANFGLVAPGVSVVTTGLNGGTASATGTSFSSPMGAGLAALVLSAKPTATPAQVQTFMRAGAVDIGQPSTVQGAGLMNAYRTMRLVEKGTMAGYDGDQKPIAFPNPFRLSQTSKVSFSIPTSLGAGALDIKVYSLDGAFVRELSQPVWDGKNADGNLVASGTYVFVVKTSKGSSRGRMAVVR